MKDFILESMRGRRGVGPSAVRAVLKALSVPYGAAVRVRNLAYSSGLFQVSRVPAAVISIGNLTAGGTGKTPAAMLVCAILRENGIPHAVLSRGFGAETPGGRADETELLGRHSDVFAGADRAASAKLACGRGARCLVLDDGFQHRSLARDLDILLVDSLDPWGGGRLLPAGFLREPVSGARRAGAVVMTRADLATGEALAGIEARLRRIGVEAPVFRACHMPAGVEGDIDGGLDRLSGRRVFLACGIGNPEGFALTAGRLPLTVTGRAFFPDHHGYSRGDFEAVIRSAARSGAEAVLTTTKDFVKLAGFGRNEMPLCALKIRFEVIDRDAEFVKMVMNAAGKS